MLHRLSANGHGYRFSASVPHPHLTGLKPLSTRSSVSSVDSRPLYTSRAIGLAPLHALRTQNRKARQRRPSRALAPSPARSLAAPPMGVVDHHALRAAAEIRRIAHKDLAIETLKRSDTPERTTCANNKGPPTPSTHCPGFTVSSTPWGDVSCCSSSLGENSYYAAASLANWVMPWRQQKAVDA